MKIRNGFVSNSSSSSFLVAFDKVPEKLEEVKNLMFPDKENNHTIEGINILELVLDIFKNIKKPLSKKEVLEVFIQGTSRYYGIESSKESEEKYLRERGFEEESINNILELSSFAQPSLEDCFCVDEEQYQNVLLETNKTKQLSDEINFLCRSLNESWASKNPLIKNKYSKYRNQKFIEQEAKEKLAIKDGEYFLKKNKDKVIFLFEFSDHSYEENFSYLESYEECWGELKHVCFSNH